jgi:hypothetical protein
MENRRKIISHSTIRNTSSNDRKNSTPGSSEHEFAHTILLVWSQSELTFAATVDDVARIVSFRAKWGNTVTRAYCLIAACNPSRHSLPTGGRNTSLPR